MQDFVGYNNAHSSLTRSFCVSGFTSIIILFRMFRLGQQSLRLIQRRLVAVRRPIAPRPLLADRGVAAGLGAVAGVERQAGQEVVDVGLRQAVLAAVGDR